MNALISLAGSNRCNADLSTDTLTTMSFFRPQPIWIQETMPNASYNVDLISRCQCLAVAKPMFADMWVTFRTFFVPYRMVFPNWNDFISDTSSKNRKVSIVPCISQWDLMSGLLNSRFITAERIPNAEETKKYDFVVPHYDNINKSNVEYKIGFIFTSRGRRALNVYRALGYVLPFGALWEYGSWNVMNWGDYTSMPDTERQKLGTVSLLPLMCYVKICADWFVMPSYADRINQLNAWLAEVSDHGYFTDSQIFSCADALAMCLDMHYSDDFFVNAWDSPVSPNPQTSLTDTMTFTDVTNNATNDMYRMSVSPGVGQPNAYSASNGTPQLRSSNGTTAQTSNITQYILNALQKLSSYNRRNQLSGFRAVDRILARFGVKLDNDKVNRCYKLHSSKMRIDIGEIISQTDSYEQNGALLGQKAGQGYGQGDTHFSFKAEEHGFLITLAYIMPYIKYFQGIRPHAQRFSRSEFFIPEFDALGCEAIPSSALFNDAKNTVGYVGMPEDHDYGDGVFGFAPRYATFKTNPYALVNGDFAYPSRNVAMNQWHLFRDLYPTLKNRGDILKHDQAFTFGSYDASEYARMFQMADDSYDGFYLGIHFNVKASLPCKPLYDDDILNTDPDSEHSRKIDMQVGGSYLG